MIQWMISSDDDVTLLNRESDVHQLIKLRVIQTTASLNTSPAIHVLIVWQFLKRVIPNTNKLSTDGFRNALHFK